MKKTVVIIEIIIATLLLLAAIAVGVGIVLGKSIPGLSHEIVPTTETVAATETAESTVPSTAPTLPEEATEPTEATEPPEEQESIITWKTFEVDRELTAARAFVYDCQTSSFLYLKGEASETLYMASITKLFSAYVATQYLDPEMLLTVSEDVLAMIPEDSSTAGLKAGEVLSVSQLIEGMLLPSGNDAAHMIAMAAGRELAGDPELPVADAVAVFVDEMNKQAKNYGLNGTRFANPDGYHHEEHYTTIRDLATIGELALRNELIMSFATVAKATITPVLGEEKEWLNTNLLINPEYEYYCPYAVGLKTGQTDAAGKCQLSAFDIDGKQYIIGVFGSAGFNERLDDTLQLFNSKVIANLDPETMS